MELSSIRVQRKKNEDLIDLGQHQSIFDVNTFKRLLPYLPHLASGEKKKKDDIVKGQQFWDYTKKHPYTQLLMHWLFSAFYA